MNGLPWREHYPAGTQPDIGEPPARNVPELLRPSAALDADAVAFTQCMPNGMNGSLRYGEVERLADEFAVYLREVVGLDAGDRVAVQLPNCLSYPVVAFGILKAGCVLVNTNPLYTASEMTHQFRDSGARALVIIDMFADRLPQVLPATRIESVVTVRISDFFPAVVAGIIRATQRYWSRTIPPITVEHTPLQAALAAGRDRLERGAEAQAYLEGIGLDSVAALQYTGGTTGVSKGAMLSHGNLVANTLQMLEMCGSHLRPGKETVLTALPLYHVFAFTVNLIGFYYRSGRNILIPSPRPPSNLRRAFENYPITWLSGVNTLFNALLNERWFLEYPPRHLRASVAGGMALHQSVAEHWRDVTGTPIVEGYGLTESSPVLTFNPLGGSVKDGTIGIPVPSTEIRCLDDAGNPLPPGEPGELVARGPQIMQGYWQRPEETQQTLADGWLHTGDIAEMDEEGYFRIVDRKKDMVLVSGFNVYPNEVEECIAALPNVREAGVIGVPDPKTGEAVRAFVVADEPAPSQSDIIAHCREYLAPYKVPRSVEYRDELPKSPIGKILRKELRTEVGAKPASGTTGSTPEATTGSQEA
ncbi:AMP-binding protein [Natronosporangium hydrolyticum]|uniref:Long-chain-fatty-acid--CoA ligase n=1 Tax=Natronosporangium hydrolyticum TaxID=2811111 RepID=A0A895YHF1_9ACTN|nr:AMP-binding protein [Natronosporangium hydrolyticum]QSB13148.1 AMP-binding protein [Natronosporangium hydrolyticum]